MADSRIENLLEDETSEVPQSEIERILVGEDVEPQCRIGVLLKEKLNGQDGE